jgi:hypothetical protein
MLNMNEGRLGNKMNTEITQAITELKQAEQNFNYATPEFVDVALLQLSAAEMKVDTLLNLRKQNGPSRMDPSVREQSLTKIFELIIPQKQQTGKRKIQINAVNVMDRPGKHLTFIGKNF